MALKFDMSRNQFADAMYQQMAMDQQKALGQNIGDSLGLLAKTWSDDYSKQGKAYNRYVKRKEEQGKPALTRRQWVAEHWKGHPDYKAFKDRAIPSALKNIYHGKDQEKGLSGLFGNIKGMSGEERAMSALGLLGLGVAPVPTIGAGIGLFADKKLSEAYGKDYIEKGKEDIRQRVQAARHSLGEKVQETKEGILSAPKSILQRVMDKRDERKAKRWEKKMAKADAKLPSLETDNYIPPYIRLEDGTLTPLGDSTAIPADDFTQYQGPGGGGVSPTLGMKMVADKSSSPASHTKPKLKLPPQMRGMKELRDTREFLKAQEMYKDLSPLEQRYLPKPGQSIKAKPRPAYQRYLPMPGSRSSILSNPNLLGAYRSTPTPGYQGYGQYLHPKTNLNPFLDNNPIIEPSIEDSTMFQLGDY